MEVFQFGSGTPEAHVLRAAHLGFLGGGQEAGPREGS